MRISITIRFERVFINEQRENTGTRSTVAEDCRVRLDEKPSHEHTKELDVGARNFVCYSRRAECHCFSVGTASMNRGMNFLSSLSSSYKSASTS